MQTRWRNWPLLISVSTPLLYGGMEEKTEARPGKRRKRAFMIRDILEDDGGKKVDSPNVNAALDLRTSKEEEANPDCCLPGQLCEL